MGSLSAEQQRGYRELMGRELLDFDQDISVGAVEFSEGGLKAIDSVAAAIDTPGIMANHARVFAMNMGEGCAEALMAHTTPEKAREIGQSLVGNVVPNVSELFIAGLDEATRRVEEQNTGVAV